MGDAGPIADQARADLEELRATLDKRIRALLLKLSTKDGVLVRDELANAARVRSQVLDLLRAGEAEVVTRVLDERAAQAAAAALKGLPGPKEGFAADAGPMLQAIVDGMTEEVAGSFGRARNDIRRAIARGTTTSAPIEGLISSAADALDTTFAKASSAVDTGIIGTGRAVLMQQTARAAADGAGEDFVFRYVGPDDSKTRPFCRARLGKVFSRDAVDAWDNGAGQPKPASTFLGGYLCRHQLAPLLRSQAEADGISIIEA